VNNCAGRADSQAHINAEKNQGRSETVTVQSGSGATTAGTNLWGATRSAHVLSTAAGWANIFCGATSAVLAGVTATGTAHSLLGGTSLVTDLEGTASAGHIRAGATILLHAAEFPELSGMPPE